MAAKIWGLGGVLEDKHLIGSPLATGLYQTGAPGPGVAVQGEYYCPGLPLLPVKHPLHGSQIILTRKGLPLKNNLYGPVQALDFLPGDWPKVGEHVQEFDLGCADNKLRQPYLEVLAASRTGTGITPLFQHGPGQRLPQVVDMAADQILVKIVSELGGQQVCRKDDAQKLKHLSAAGIAHTAPHLLWA
jgi:hypothetical protein